MGTRFIASGDYNAKHPWWGSRSHISTPKERQLFQSMSENNLYPISTSKPTYWPMDKRKTPDVINFYITKRISEHHLKAESHFDLASDHSPVIVSLSTAVLKKEKTIALNNANTN